MSALTSLLPGLREARAPLISGYLWLLAVWLVFGPLLPDRHTDSTYAQLWVVIDAVGPFGVAFALSIVAYLVGSLVQSSIRFLASQLAKWQRHLRLKSQRDGSGGQAGNGALSGDAQLILSESGDGVWIPVAKLPSAIEKDLLTYYPTDSDPRWMAGFNDLVTRELGHAWHQLAEAASHAARIYGPHAAVRYNANRGRDTIVEIPQLKELVSFVIPLAFLGGLSLIQNRLLELTEHSGLKVEQINAEAEFREAIAIALVALFAVLIAQVGIGWIAALTIPLALLLQARSLRRRGRLDLIDALRARAGTPELEQITPLFARCRAQMEEISRAIDSADWSHSRASMSTRPAMTPMRTPSE